jgi:hypothetical protein
MQLTPAEHQYDMLVLDQFGPVLNDQHAAVTARLLWSRGIVRRFGERRYSVPVEGAASIRLCFSAHHAAAVGHTVANSGELLAAVEASPFFKWRPHPGEMQSRSERVEVLCERYDTPGLDAIEWPAVVAAPPGPWPAGAVLLLEWALLLHPDHPVVTTTSTELERLSPVCRAARRAVWGTPRACAVAPGQPPPALTVSCRPGAGVSLAPAKASPPTDPVYRQLTAQRHSRIVDAEFAKACKIDNTATAF